MGEDGARFAVRVVVMGNKCSGRGRRLLKLIVAEVENNNSSRLEVTHG